MQLGLREVPERSIPPVATSPSSGKSSWGGAGLLRGGLPKPTKPCRILLPTARAVPRDLGERTASAPPCRWGERAGSGGVFAHPLGCRRGTWPLFGMVSHEGWMGRRSGGSFMARGGASSFPPGGGVRRGCCGVTASGADNTRCLGTDFPPRRSVCRNRLLFLLWWLLGL